MKRASGVLMHISSLSNNYGIGSFGKEAYEFVDFLVNTGQSYWQILPLTTTSYGNSPYASYSAFAGNTDFINLGLLVEEGFLQETDFEGVHFGNEVDKVDYEQVQKARRPLLEKAVYNFVQSGGIYWEDYQNFLEKQKEWLLPFSQFMTLKEKFNLMPWFEWPKEYRYYPEYIKNISPKADKKQLNYHLVTQYWFFKQWHALKSYANNRQISIIGDIPIYVAHDSVELWETPELFLVDDHHVPKVVSGTPPDAFADEGQYWGNPIYDWEYMKETGYQWWIHRIEENLILYDYVRLDHFRGFEAYWEIPYGASSAKEGHWAKGPDKKLFQALNGALGEVKLIAEDLGYITHEVEELLAYTKYPGMKILQHAFTGAEDSDHMPHHFMRNTIAYVGTHDNETGLGWYQDSTNQAQRDQLDEYLNRRSGEHVSDALNRGLAASISNVVIYTMQDLLRLGNESRMNIPSTIGNNWEWRIKPNAVTVDLNERLLDWTQTYYRMNNSVKNT